MMKKLLLILAVAVITLQSCNAGQTKNKDGNQQAEVAAVSENTNTGGTQNLTRDKFLKEIFDYTNSQEWDYKGDKPAIIDFYADWCGPCKIAAPILDEVAREYAGKVNVYKVDTQVERELASAFGISSIPAFLYIPMEGKPVMINGIARSKEQTKQMFIDNINKILLTSN